MSGPAGNNRKITAENDRKYLKCEDRYVNIILRDESISLLVCRIRARDQKEVANNEQV